MADIVPILRDWASRSLKSVTITTLLADAADEIERLRSVCEEAQEFIDHDKNCAYLMGRMRNCSCGFDKMWSRLDEVRS